MSIDHLSLSMLKLHAEAYQLNIEFLCSSNKLHSLKQFDFCHQKNGFVKELIDLYSLNHKFQMPFDGITGAFSARDVTCMKQIFNKIDFTADADTILTLDMKGSERGYVDQNIVSSEEKFCTAFSYSCQTTSKSAKQALSLLTNKLGYVFCEGSLKASLLGQFEEGQAAYLNSPKAVTEFCALTEVFMNAAKFGHTTKQVASEKFIYSVSKTSTPFQPHSVSTVWLPPLYYDSSSAVTQMFSPVFHTQKENDDQTKLTKLTIKVTS